MRLYCEFCGQPFQPNPKATNQKFCKGLKCKKDRRAVWQKKKELQKRTIEKIKHKLKKIGKKNGPTIVKIIEQTIQSIQKETGNCKKVGMKSGKNG